MDTHICGCPAQSVAPILEPIDDDHEANTKTKRSFTVNKKNRLLVGLS